MKICEGNGEGRQRRLGEPRDHRIGPTQVERQDNKGSRMKNREVLDWRVDLRNPGKADGEFSGPVSGVLHLAGIGRP